MEKLRINEWMMQDNQLLLGYAECGRWRVEIEVPLAHKEPGSYEFWINLVNLDTEEDYDTTIKDKFMSIADVMDYINEMDEDDLDILFLENN